MCQRSAWFAMSLHTPSHQVTLLQTHEITHTHIYIYKENLINNIFKRAPSFSFRVGTRDDTKVAAEYCWAITQTARALMRGPIPFQRFASNFGWTPLYTHTHTDSWPYVHTIPTCAKFKLRRIFRTVNHCVSWAVSTVLRAAPQHTTPTILCCTRIVHPCDRTLHRHMSARHFHQLTFWRRNYFFNFGTLCI